MPVNPTAPSSRPLPPGSQQPLFPQDAATKKAQNERPAPPSAGRRTDDVLTRSPGATPPAPSNPYTGRPTPPPVIVNDRPTPPSVTDRPAPPAVHVPRYFYSPSWPVYVPSNPQPLATVRIAPPPAGARHVDMAEVSNDPIALLVEQGRLREEKKHTLWPTTYDKVTVDQAKALLASGKLFIAPDGGSHLSSKAYQHTDQNAINALLPGLKADKLSELQRAEDRAAQDRLSSWNEGDIRNREAALPAFNSIYNMEQLNLNNFMVGAGNGKSVNRLLITAMNLYKQGSTQREIAEKWHANPEMSKQEFAQMANSVLMRKVQNLEWNAQFSGDWDTYLGQNPVPGLRYPDTDEDVAYNQRVIQDTAQKLMYTLPTAVSGR